MKNRLIKIITKPVVMAMIIASLFTVAVPDSAHSDGLIEVKKAWLRATPPSAKAAGGYLIIVNNTHNDDTLTGVNFSGARKSEVHEMKMADGVMKMRPLENGIDIPAGKSVTLKPGGYHLMFMGLKEQLKDGQNFPIMLKFARSGELEVNFPVFAMDKGKKYMMQEE